MGAGSTCSQSGTTITIEDGNTFSSDMAGMYFVWPASSGVPTHRSYISSYVDSTHISVSKSETVASTAGCHVQARINATFFDEVHGYIFMLLGTKIYRANASIDSWKQVYLLGKTSPHNSFSRFYRIEDSIYLVNANGIYRISKIDEDGNKMYFWKCNDYQPSIEDKIDEANASSYKSFQYRYIYTLSRFKNAMLDGDRLDADDGVILEQETCSAVKTSDEEDYSTVHTKHPAGNYTIIKGINRNNKGWTNFFGDSVVWYFTQVDFWKKRGDVSLGLRVRQDNGTEIVHRIYPVFRYAQDLNDIAKAIQKALRVYLPNCYFFFVTNDEYTGESYFCMYSSSEDDEIVNFESLDDGNNTDGYAFNIVGDLGLDENYTTTKYNSGHTITGLRIPRLKDKNSSIATYNPTHYSIYRTKNLSEALADEQDINNPDIINNPHLFVWVADIPVCKPVMVDISSNGVLVQSADILKEEDVGSVLWVHGEEVLLEEMSGEGTFNVILNDGSGSNTPTGTGGYVHGCIGSRDYFEASKSSTTVTASNWTFVAADVGKMIFWEDGSVSIIKSVSGGVASTVDTDNKTQQAAAINPTTRNFFDGINDKQLEARTESWVLETRNFKRMPDPSFGAVIPGYLIIAQQDFGDWYYCSTDDAHQIGYYHGVGQHNKKIKEGLTELTVVKENLILRCKHKTYRVNPQYAIPLGNPKFGESYWNLGDPMMVSDNIGVLNNTSSINLDDGTQMVWTCEPAIRFFDGNTYSEDISLHKIHDTELCKLEPIIIMDYDHTLGFNLWGKQVTVLAE